MLLHLFFSLFVFFTLIDNGNAGVTSSFVRKEFPAVDIPLDNEVFAVPKGYNAPQQVHITQGDYEGKSVIVSWVTPVNRGLVKYVTDYLRENMILQLKDHLQTTHFTPTSLDIYTSAFLTDFRNFWFETPPKVDPDASYTFGIIGDLGQTYNSLSTLQHYMSSGAKSVLFVGDLSYADRYKYHDVGVRWDSWGRFVEPSTAYQPWIWNTGNHEIEYMPYMGEVTMFKSYLYRYPTPYQASNSTSPLWYSIRRASAHIIVLSTYSPFVKYTPQWKWLREEFKNIDREKTPWLIVLMHVPIYNSNVAHFMEGESMRSVFEAWFIEHKVDVIFAGHVHAYERSYRISNIHFNISSGDPYPVPDETAPVYITVGDGGNKEGLAARFRDPQPDYSAFRESSYGHSTLEIKNRTHAFYHWNRNDDGKKVQIDSFVLHNLYWGQNHHQRKSKQNRLRSLILNRASTAQL